MEIRESAEDYLERILMLNKSMGQVRAVDIANLMNFSKQSVSIAPVSYTHLDVYKRPLP